MKLYLKNGPKAGSSWELTPPGINIGRENDNDIQILTGGVSRYHAKITPEGNQWKIEDLGSTNGTRINGEKILGPVFLREGDIITVGEQTLCAGEITQKQETAPKSSIKMPVFSQQEPKEAPAAASSAQPSPSAPEKKAPSAPLTNLGDIFGKKSSKKDGDALSPDGKKKKIMSNLTFTVLVIALAAIALAIFMKINEPKKLPARKKAPAIVNTFCAIYEKQEITNDSIFRFAMSLEDNKVTFSVDEHKAKDNISYKYASAPVTVSKELLTKLQKDLKNTSFMNLKQEMLSPGSRGEDKMLKITIAQGSSTNTITVKNTFPQKSFSETAGILESFIEEVSGIRTVSMSVEEMRAQAEKNFRTARDLFDNYQAKPQNLRECISRFQFVATLLERFQPRPPMWQEAKEKAVQAKEILNRILKTTYDDMMIQYRLKNRAASLQKAKILLDYMNPESVNYEKIRSLKIELERDLARNKRRK